MKRFLLALMTGLWGGATMFAISGLPGIGQDFDLVLLAAAGAAVAGAVTAPLFAKSQAFWTLVAAVLATTLGASLTGGFVGFPSDFAPGLIMAPVMVWAGIVQSPLVALVWLAGALTVRVTARTLAAT